MLLFLCSTIPLPFTLYPRVPVCWMVLSRQVNSAGQGDEFVFKENGKRVEKKRDYLFSKRSDKL